MGTVGVGPTADAIGAALGAVRRRLGRPWASRGAREVGYFTLCVCHHPFALCVPPSVCVQSGYTFVLVAESAAVRALWGATGHLERRPLRPRGVC